MKLLSKLFDRMFGGGLEDDIGHTIDHVVPAKPADDDLAKVAAEHAAKLKAARRRHGREFRSHEERERDTAPSDALKKIVEKSKTPRRPAARHESKANVSTLTQAKRKTS